MNRKQCDWRRYTRAEYLTAFADSNYVAGSGKLKFGFFHGLNEIEGRSEFCMFNRLFCETQFIKAAQDEILPTVEHQQQKYQNNRAENSHQPTRSREGDETIQVGGPRAALPFGLRDYQLTLPCGKTSVQS